MKRTLLFLTAVAFFASCSTPKYSYNFDHYNYNSGKKKATTTPDFSLSDGPQAIQPEMLTASTSVEVAPTQTITPSVEKSTLSKKTYNQLTKSERTDVKNSVKEIKKAIKAEKSVKAATSTNRMDNDLKLAAIFGAVGIVALIVSGNVFYIIGGIALIIGVVFFVKWLINQ